MNLINPYIFAAAAPSNYVTWQGHALCTDFSPGGLDCSGVLSWGAHAYSLEEKSSGNVRVEHTAAVSGNRIVGLTNATSALTEAFNTLDFGVFCFTTTIYAIKDGSVTAIAGFATNDILAVQVNGANVEILQNGSVVFTWTAPTISYPLKAMAFMEATTGIREAKIFLV